MTSLGWKEFQAHVIFSLGISGGNGQGGTLHVNACFSINVFLCYALVTHVYHQELDSCPKTKKIEL